MAAHHYPSTPSRVPRGAGHGQCLNISALTTGQQQLGNIACAASATHAQMIVRNKMIDDVAHSKSRPVIKRSGWPLTLQQLSLV